MSTCSLPRSHGKHREALVAFSTSALHTMSNLTALLVFALHGNDVGTAHLGRLYSCRSLCRNFPLFNPYPMYFSLFEHDRFNYPLKSSSIAHVPLVAANGTAESTVGVCINEGESKRRGK